MSNENILFEKIGSIAILTIDHPPVNALSLKIVKEMYRKIQILEEDVDTRVLILTGSGAKCFSGGYDLKDTANIEEISPLGQTLWRKVDRFSKPIIAAINGHAIGGGCELAMACHIRVMTKNPRAKIGLPELNLGLIPAWGGTQRLTRLVGAAKATEMILFSKKITSQEALEIGLVNRVVVQNQLKTKTMELSQRLTELAPIAVKYTLKAISKGIYEGIDAGLEAESEGGAKVRKSADFKEGLEAFMQKRKPVFRGL